MTEAKNLLHPLKLNVQSFKEEGHDYHFHVELPEPVVCQACGALEGKLVKFGKEDQSFRDVPIHGKRSTIWVIRRRYRCADCNSTFRQPVPHMDDKRSMTSRLVRHIERASMLGINTDVARDVGVDEHTVRRIFEDYYQAEDAKYTPKAPKVLGIDELFLGKEYRAIFTNITEQTVIELLPSRTLKTVTHFLGNLEGRKDIQIVCTDMWGSYRTAVKSVLPNATMVVDKFHITRMANEAMDTVRKGLKASLNANQRRTLKGDRKSLLMRKHDLKAWQSLVMETWLNAFPELNVAYGLKEGFYGIWDAKSESEAKELYREWARGIPAEQKEVWEPLTRAMTNWEREVFAYFKPGHQFTNAFTESSNRNIKTQQRDARGMKFESYRAKVLFSQQHKVVRPKPRKESPFDGVGYFTPFSFQEVEGIDYGVPISTVMRLLEAGEL